MDGFAAACDVRGDHSAGPVVEDRRAILRVDHACRVREGVTMTPAASGE